MAPFPEDIDVFTVPHSRMKQLVQIYSQKLTSTNFKNYCDFENLLSDLYATFIEFKTHEKIENEEIMKRLKLKLKALSISNSAVCNCHSDNRLSEMLELFHNGFRCNRRTDLERLRFAAELRFALEDFTGKFIPHMQEEEDVFQPLLMKYFTFDELRHMKDVVLTRHERWKENRDEVKEMFLKEEKQDKEKCNSEQVEKESESKDEIEKESTAAILDLPPEIASQVFSHLGARDLLRCAQVCRHWSKLVVDPVLWTHIRPLAWAQGDWSIREPSEEMEPDESVSLNDADDDPDSYKSSHRDEDADIDESSDSESTTSMGSNHDSSNDDYVEQRWRLVREMTVMAGLAKHLIAKIGSGVKTLHLSKSFGIHNRTVRKILSCCPNLEHLDLSYTDMNDTAFKGLDGCLTKLRHLDVSGCINISNHGLERLALSLVERGSVATETTDWGGGVAPMSGVEEAMVARGDGAFECGRGDKCCRMQQNLVAVVAAPPGGEAMDVDGDGSVGAIENCHVVSPRAARCQMVGGDCGVYSMAVELDAYCRREVAPQCVPDGGSIYTATPGGGTRRVDCRSVSRTTAGSPPGGRLVFLSLSGLALITDDGLRWFVNIGGLPLLQHMDMSGCFQLTGESIAAVVDSATYLPPHKLFYCDNILDGPYPQDASGCSNLECGSRFCCRAGY
ncbi:PREDICTED: F-box/LRR-repeat protein 5-like [Priapulus caudatus]|uniref:F-box/LRR-repeat protein 5-like n=1 Tax=Priapulus caudatus TaxID=37621 RepID=A0ABM1DVA1_PRICU|nr:PREDICTED: F-box/LRR-repeat protein 5-like [Priapulus caudatus]